MTVHRAPLTNHHSDDSLCPPDHKHTSSGKPLHPDCPGRAYSSAVCTCGSWEFKGPARTTSTSPASATSTPTPGPVRRPRPCCERGSASTSRDHRPHPHRRPLHHPETAVPQYLTVAHLIAQLQDLDPNLRVRLAVNPDWPFSHLLASNVTVHDGLVYLAEDGQEGYLPTAVREELAWA
ncbi:hypothetical protein [Kitasatospora sp. NPDC085464]|uniref:hypothetical protein n=1 Tax=Kitasatospora sp. NPDC085464 TaxID=3364063 RepID=UPI0037C576B2